jgi:hypothetical protein
VSCTGYYNNITKQEGIFELKLRLTGCELKDEIRRVEGFGLMEEDKG